MRILGSTNQIALLVARLILAVQRRRRRKIEEEWLRRARWFMGAEGLSVVDVSIVPSIPTTLTRATVYVIAQKVS